MTSLLFAALTGAALMLSPLASASPATTPAEARAIAKEAFIYGYPMVDGYRIQHAYFVDTANAEYKGPWNAVHSVARVYTPDDTAVQTPNSDTPYSMLGVDLRTEPQVLTLPAMDAKRYFSVQFIDLYTHNFAYAGTRTTGNGGSRLLLAGPGWKGPVPKGIDKVIRSETALALGVVRTQLFGADDLVNVRKVQAGYTLQPLSAWLAKPAPAAAPAIDFPRPLSPAAQRDSLDAFALLDFLLRLSPTTADEKALMARFAKIGIGAGKSFDATKLTPDTRAAMQAGIGDAWKDFAALKLRIDRKEVTSGDLFGTRTFLKNNYLYRMAGAVLGIYGNSREEAMYPIYTVDAEGKPLSGANRYTVRFAPGRPPPVNAFWSLTMYRLPESLLVANALKRYLINSPMLPNLKRDADGGITIYVQHDSPGAAREANWLPAPQGPFMAAMRLYLPKPEALEGKWQAPPMVKTP